MEDTDLVAAASVIPDEAEPVNGEGQLPLQ
jgi:hypothetical protein